MPRLSDNMAGTERFQLRTVFWQGAKYLIFLYLLLVAPLCENTAKHGFHHKTHSESFFEGTNDTVVTVSVSSDSRPDF